MCCVKERQSGRRADYDKKNEIYYLIFTKDSGHCCFQLIVTHLNPDFMLCRITHTCNAISDLLTSDILVLCDLEWQLLYVAITYNNCGTVALKIRTFVIRQSNNLHNKGSIKSNSKA